MAVEENTNAFLKDFVRREVIFRGRIEKFTLNRHEDNPFVVALLRESEVVVAGHVHEIDHAWIQHAEALENFKVGTRVEFRCVVREYQSKGMLKYGLKKPSNIKEIGKGGIALKIPETLVTTQKPIGTVPAKAPVEEKQPEAKQSAAQAMDPLTALKEVKALATKLGGLKNLRAFVDELENV